jgi:acyl carrier protein
MVARMTVLDVIEKETADTVSEDQRIDDLGLDSLELLQLQLNIEQAFSIKIPDQDFSKAQTVADLITITDRLRHVPA